MMLTLVCILMFVLSGCGLEKKPDIQLSVEVNHLTDEEYSFVGTSGIENSNKSDFRVFLFKLRIDNLDNLSDRSIVVPRFEAAFNQFDGEHRLWFGNTLEQDNDNEDFAIFEKNYTLFVRGLDEKDFRDMLNEFNVECSWRNAEGVNETQTFNLAEELVFN